MLYQTIRRSMAWAATIVVALGLWASAPANAAVPAASRIAVGPSHALQAPPNAVASDGVIELAQNRRAGNRGGRRARNRGVRQRQRARTRGVRQRQNIRTRNVRARERARTRRVVRGGQRYGRRGYGRRYYRGGRRYYGRGPRYYYYDNGADVGAAVAAGVIGLAAGAIVGGALAAPGSNTVIIDDVGVPAPFSGEWYRRCDIKYRSFRASDGTFLGYDGIRRTCRLP